MGYRAWVMMMGLGLLVSGCAMGGQSVAPDTRPDDFQVEYHWDAGSLPPPYHYEYSIHIGPEAQGTVIFQPDYSSETTPVWQETVTLTEADLDGLYALTREHGLFTQSWRAAEDTPTGGSLDYLAATADGQQFQIPAFLEEEEQTVAAQAMYDAIRALIPQETWHKMETQRAEYEAEQLEGE